MPDKYAPVSAVPIDYKTVQTVRDTRLVHVVRFTFESPTADHNWTDFRVYAKDSLASLMVCCPWSKDRWLKLFTPYGDELQGRRIPVNLPEQAHLQAVLRSTRALLDLGWREMIRKDQKYFSVEVSVPAPIRGPDHVPVGGSARLITIRGLAEAFQCPIYRAEMWLDQLKVPTLRDPQGREMFDLFDLEMSLISLRYPSMSPAQRMQMLRERGLIYEALGTAQLKAHLTRIGEQVYKSIPRELKRRGSLKSARSYGEMAFDRYLPPTETPSRPSSNSSTSSPSDDPSGPATGTSTEKSSSTPASPATTPPPTPPESQPPEKSAQSRAKSWKQKGTSAIRALSQAPTGSPPKPQAGA